MQVLNIFNLKQGSSCLLSQFNELHKVNLVEIDSKIESFRTRVKNVINISCKESYQRYKTEKKITFESIIISILYLKNNINIIIRFLYKNLKKFFNLFY